MDYYDYLYNDKDINMVLDSMNQVLNGYYENKFPTCHGRYHVMFVVEKIEYILKSLSYDSRTIELGKVIALLHDIGMITGRWQHAKKSAALAAIIFDGSKHLQVHEKEILVHAISDHSSCKKVMSIVGAALIIADKVDYSKKRVLPIDVMDAFHRSLLRVDDVELNIVDRTMIINFVTSDGFDKELFVCGYDHAYKRLVKAAKYLGCICQIYFNGLEEEFA